MRPQTLLYVGSAVYGFCVLVGIAVLGFVVAPFVGVASGLFPIDVESSAFFSLLTLKSAPYLFGLAAASGSLYAILARRAWPLRAAGFLLNVVAAWSIGAAIALFVLG